MGLDVCHDESSVTTQQPPVRRSVAAVPAGHQYVQVPADGAVVYARAVRRHGAPDLAPANAGRFAGPKPAGWKNPVGRGILCGVLSWLLVGVAVVLMFPHFPQFAAITALFAPFVGIFFGYMEFLLIERHNGRLERLARPG